MNQLVKSHGFIIKHFIIGAYLKNSAYIFSRNNDSGIWNQTSILTPSKSSNEFGHSVSIYNDTCVVSDRLGDVAYKYKLKWNDTTKWQEASYFDVSSNVRSVDVFGDFIAIILPSSDFVYIYQGT